MAKKTSFDVSSFIPSTAVDYHKMGYEDSVGIIQDELLKTKKSFVKIGWYLKHIRDEKMYEQDGYTDIFSLAQDKFGITQSTANRFMNVCEEFSIGGDSPELDERYLEYSVSQLFEMLPMKENEREDLSPDMSVKQIREVKEKKEKADVTDEQIMAFFSIYDEYIPTMYDSAKELAGQLKAGLGDCHTGGVDGELSYSCTPRGISINSSDEFTWLNFAKRAYKLFSEAVNEKLDKESPNSPESEEEYSAHEQEHISKNDEKRLPNMSEIKPTSPKVRELSETEKAEYDSLVAGSEQLGMEEYDASANSDDDNEDNKKISISSETLKYIIEGEYTKSMDFGFGDFITNINSVIDIIAESPDVSPITLYNNFCDLRRED